MTIEALIKAIPPPTAPFEAYIGPWQPFETALGTPLPQDYKDFVRLYGSGRWVEFFGISVPVSRSPNLRLVPHAHAVAGMFRAMEEPPYPPYPLWPAAGGLLPFGGSDNGDEFFWLSQGAPADWRVVVWDRGMDEFETLDCDLTDFIAGIVTGEIAPKQFPEDLLPCYCLFRPYSYRDYGEFRMSWRVSYGRPPTETPGADSAEEEGRD